MDELIMKRDIDYFYGLTIDELKTKFLKHFTIDDIPINDRKSTMICMLLQREENDASEN